MREIEKERGKLLPKPSKYLGTRGKGAHGWMTTFEIWALINRRRFRTNQDKIAYALALIGNKEHPQPKNWAIPLQQSMMDGIPHVYV